MPQPNVGGFILGVTEQKGTTGIGNALEEIEARYPRVRDGSNGLGSGGEGSVEADGFVETTTIIAHQPRRYGDSISSGFRSQESDMPIASVIAVELQPGEDFLDE